jgi:hypothetical protein
MCVHAGLEGGVIRDAEAFQESTGSFGGAEDEDNQLAPITYSHLYGLTTN